MTRQVLQPRPPWPVISVTWSKTKDLGRASVHADRHARINEAVEFGLDSYMAGWPPVMIALHEPTIIMLL